MTVFHYPGNFRVGVRHEQIQKDTPSSRVIGEERMLLMVLLNGYQRLAFEGKVFTLSTLSPQEPGPKAIFLYLRQGQRVEYLESYGAPLTKVSVSFDRDWLSQAGSLIEEPFSPELCKIQVVTLPQKMTQRVWALNAPMRKTAQEISRLYARSTAGLSSRNAMTLLLMSLGIGLVRAALSQSGLLPEAEPNPASGPPSDPRLARLTAYVASHLTQSGWGPVEMASACGISLRSLQRLCLSAFNCTPSTFIRAQRMQAALAALTEGHVSIQQAAHIAGYSNTSNFTTAFKRSFDMTPGDCCARS